MSRMLLYVLLKVLVLAWISYADWNIILGSNSYIISFFETSCAVKYHPRFWPKMSFVLLEFLRNYIFNTLSGIPIYVSLQISLVFLESLTVIGIIFYTTNILIFVGLLLKFFMTLWLEYHPRCPLQILFLSYLTLIGILYLFVLKTLLVLLDFPGNKFLWHSQWNYNLHSVDCKCC